MSLSDDLRKFVVKSDAKTRDAFVVSAQMAYESIVNGSPLTGAPGQPVDTGALRASWQLAFESETSALISTNIEYAPENEYGVSGRDGPYTQKSAVGGRHSVALTRSGFQRIVDAAAKGVEA